MTADPSQLSLDRRPTTLVAHGSEEFFALCARSKSGEFKWSILERGHWVEGMTKTGKPKRRHVDSGWTMHVYYPNHL